MSDSHSSTSSLFVACLCADWCGTCRDYRSIFDEVAQEFSDIRFIWVDIEDEAELVDPVEAENFPTLLIAAEDGLRFFGTVLPHRDTLVRLVRSQSSGGSAVARPDPDVQALAARLRLRV
ncbi:MAG: thioredoxin family protein [Rhizobacter sp.]|nr:thioredoxin family protein [Rhizobacter sp.]